jgi:hypothetical protein
VNKLNFFQFRSLLIENFNIRFHEKYVQWPKRLCSSHTKTCSCHDRGMSKNV